MDNIVTYRVSRDHPEDHFGLNSCRLIRVLFQKVILCFVYFWNLSFVRIQRQNLSPYSLFWSVDVLDADGSSSEFSRLWDRLFHNWLSTGQLFLIALAKFQIFELARLIARKDPFVRVGRITILFCVDGA